MRILLTVLVCIACGVCFGFLGFSFGYDQGSRDSELGVTDRIRAAISRYEQENTDLRDRLSAMHTLFDQMACAVYDIKDKEKLYQEDEQAEADAASKEDDTIWAC